MKNLLLSIFILISVSSFGQKVDSIPNAIQVQPKVFNAIDNDTVYQVLIKVFDLTANDTTSGCNTYVTYHDRKGKKLHEKNVRIPAEIVNKWGTDDSILNVYVLSQINLTKRK